MIKLHNKGAFVIDGTTIISEEEAIQGALASKVGASDVLTKEEAKKNTMAYGILESHNTSGNMEQLKIKFDKLTSHDITFVGIIQTARASGLTEFPVPYDPVRPLPWKAQWWLYRCRCPSVQLSLPVFSQIPCSG